MKLFQRITNVLVYLLRYRPKNESFPVDQNETKDLRSLNFHRETTTNFIAPSTTKKTSPLNYLQLTRICSLLIALKKFQILNFY